MNALNHRFAAAVFSLGLSVMMLAVAIAPANHGVLLPGALA